MKVFVKKILQKILGFHCYLFTFSLFCIYRLRWDRKEKDFLHFLKIIKGNGIILDIGANIGIMTVHLARKFKRSRILAFEPIPDNVHVLKRILKYFSIKNVEVFELALSNQQGNAEMVMPVIDKVKMQGLSHILEGTNSEYNEGIKITAITDFIDNLNLVNEGESIEAIKIDVENFE